jgi:predicted amidophosphoribosyltransferase
LKYRNNQASVDELAVAAEDFLKIWRPPIDAIVPVPPSVPRTNQPVISVAGALAKRLGIPLCTTCIAKVKQTPQLKDMVEYDERVKALRDAFSVSPERTAGRNLLLFDDLYGSGATVRHIANLLKDPGRAKAVFLMTLTTKQ